MIIKIFIKIIITYLSFVFGQVFAADNIATPSTYKVTMKKVELCTSAGCLNPTLLAEKDGTFNIASATAGADVGDWISSFALEVGLTYTHIKATLSTTMTMAGFTTNSDISSDNCVTESSPNTASAANQGGIAATMTWIGALTNSYTPSINSSPKITIKFDVTNQLKSTQQAADTCYMWLEPPSVSVSLTD